MDQGRKVTHTVTGNIVMEGAGVKLRRMAGYYEKEWLDPFLMLDFFGSENPEDYMHGFPWHPHRGIETVTYMLEGAIRHEDSLGNNGVISRGDVQWMTAGSGIIHQEMPDAALVPMWGFQLWVNLPRDQKMCAPRYREITSGDIPSVKTENSEVKVIAGTYQGISGPVHDLVMGPFYYDVAINGQEEMQFEVPETYTVLACVFNGSGTIGEEDFQNAVSPCLYALGKGNRLRVKAGSDGMRFLLLGGEPLKEPIAWRGPIVMNTDEELKEAFSEYYNNTFLKHPTP